ncbi:MAG TPA: hypothetical protein EYH29_00115 [Caldilineales bacterium]|nr:hypothetical protein [Caldilineales bacterium]
MIAFTLFLGLAVLFAVVYAAIRLAMKGQSQVNAAPVLESQDQSEASPEPEPRPASVENPPIKHAFDFSDDNLTMILEMPASLLEDDEALAEGWVDVVSWARVTYREILERRLAESQTADEDAAAATEPKLSGEELEASLKRLHDAAERRRELRMLLNEKQAS